MTPKQKRFLAAIKKAARFEQQRTNTIGKTGRWYFDHVGVHYYPVCGRYTFFLFGKPISQRELVLWMTSPF